MFQLVLQELQLVFMNRLEEQDISFAWKPITIFSWLKSGLFCQKIYEIFFYIRLEYLWYIFISALTNDISVLHGIASWPVQDNPSIILWRCVISMLHHYLGFLYLPQNIVVGRIYWFQLVCLSCLSVGLFICPSVPPSLHASLCLSVDGFVSAL